jgi:predicted ester cyclase
MSDASSAANVELVLRHYDEFLNNGDMSAADRDLRPDFVDHAAAPGTPPGRESSKAFIAMVRSAFPDIRFTEEEVIANGDMVAVLGLWRGTHGGPFLGLEATGRHCEMRGMVLWRIAEGQLAERWAVLDYDALLEWILGDRQPSSLTSAGR